jgi:hypothetical protein
MNTNLDTIITELNDYLAADEVTDPIGYLELLQLQLQELAEQRNTREEMKASMGEGIHKGMRVYNAMEAYRAVDRLDDNTWDRILGFVVDGLQIMQVISLREES